MTQRKEVFQSKVLQKLYPAAEKDPSAPSTVEAFTQKNSMKRKASRCGNRDEGKTQHAANTGKRIYTALPPPADYNRDSEKSVIFPQRENINSAEAPAEEILHECNEDLDQDAAAEDQKRRRRRRKRTPTRHIDPGKDGISQMREAGTGQSGSPVSEEGEHISKNKKRKLKKKRHKEKLLSMGLMPQASALEFTYQKDEAEEEEEDERRAAEVSDFLRKTMEIYMSDSLLQGEKLPHPCVMVNDLLSSIASGIRPTSLLKQLHSLKTFVQQKDTDRLAKALEDLRSSDLMSAEETAAVASLFQYWITDILPMRGDEQTRPPTTHP